MSLCRDSGQAIFFLRTDRRKESRRSRSGLCPHRRIDLGGLSSSIAVRHALGLDSPLCLSHAGHSGGEERHDGGKVFCRVATLAP